ncbi:MAG: flagellar brake protein [Bacillota bacterium]
MSRPPLRVNMYATVTPVSNELGQPYRTLIQELADHGIGLGLPIHQGHYVTLPRGTVVLVEAAEKGYVYSFESKVVDLQAGAVPLMWVEWPQGWAKLQRRNFVRANCSLPVTIVKRNANGGEERHKGSTIDISGGGALLLTHASLDLGQTFWLEVQLRDSELVCTDCEVLRIEEVPGFRERPKKMAVKFLTISEADRDRLCKFIMEKLCEQRRMGLI